MGLVLGRLASPINRARRRTQPSRLTNRSRLRLLATAVMFFLASPVGGSHSQDEAERFINLGTVVSHRYRERIGISDRQ